MENKAKISYTDNKGKKVELVHKISKTKIVKVKLKNLVKRPKFCSWHKNYKDYK